MTLFRKFVFGPVSALVLPMALSVGLPVAAQALSLTDALVQVYKNNPDIIRERAVVEAADEGVSQALGGYRPTVTAAGSLSRAKTRLSTRPDQHITPLARQLEIEQPLYRGGGTAASVKSADSTVMAARARLRLVERDIFLATTIAYLDVMRDRERIKLLEKNKKAIARQLEITEARLRGRLATRTDVAQARSRLARSAADRAAAEGLLYASRAAFGRIVGLGADNLEPLSEEPELPPSLDAAIRMALAANPELAAAKYNEAAAKYSIRTAVAGLLPSVDLVATWTKIREASLERTDGEDQQIGIEVTIPLYQGGVVHSQVRQARRLRSQRLAELELARRQAVELVTVAWRTLETARLELRSRKAQLREAGLALNGVREESIAGIRTVLDLLDAEQEVTDAEIGAVVAQRDVMAASYNLLAATGQLGADKLELPVAVYDPAVHYKRVRNKWFGWGFLDGD